MTWSGYAGEIHLLVTDKYLFFEFWSVGATCVERVRFFEQQQTIALVAEVEKLRSLAESKDAYAWCRPCVLVLSIYSLINSAKKKQKTTLLSHWLRWLEKKMSQAQSAMMMSIGLFALITLLFLRLSWVIKRFCDPDGDMLILDGGCCSSSGNIEYLTVRAKYVETATWTDLFGNWTKPRSFRKRYRQPVSIEPYFWLQPLKKNLTNFAITTRIRWFNNRRSSVERAIHAKKRCRPQKQSQKLSRTAQLRLKWSMSSHKKVWYSL